MILIQTKFAEAILTSEYSQASAAIIDKFVANNVDTVDRTLTIHVVPESGTPGNSNKVCVVTLSPGASYLVPELTGDTIHSGESIRVQADAASAIVIRATGRAR